MVGYFIVNSKTKAGFRILLGDATVASVHVLFDESIPEKSADYYRELDEATVKVDPQKQLVSDFDGIVGQNHMEDGLLYKATRVVVRKDLNVGFRALINAGRQQIEDETPVHVAYNPRLRSSRDDCD